MAYKVIYTNSFKKSLRQCHKRGYDINLAKYVITLLEENGQLPSKYRPHKLTGNYNGFWECHIKPDWLLIWKQDDKNLILLFSHTGTHADLFE